MKRKLSIRVALATILIALSGTFLMAKPTKAWGPTRTTFTNQVPATYVTFNSITNNVAVGDERNFVRIREAGATSMSNTLQVIPGKEYEVFIYYHNNAAYNLNASGKGIATGVKVSTAYPAILHKGENGMVRGTISSSNAIPEKVWDEAYFTTSYDEVKMHYKAGSATIHNAGKVSGSVLSSNLFTESGTYIGINSLNGLIPGCSQYSGYITYTLVAEKTSSTLSKQVSIDGKTWSNKVTADAGEYVTYKVAFQNTGNTTITNAIFTDAHDNGLTIRPGSIKVYDVNNTSGKTIPNIIDISGYNVGNVPAGAPVQIIYQARVSDDQSYCDKTLNNSISVKYNSSAAPVQQDGAQVTVHCDIISSTTTKEVSTDGKTWTKSVTAEPGSKVYYRITFKNTGNTDLTNVILKDTPASGISYIPGTAKSGSNIIGDVINSGYSAGTIKPNGTVQITYESQVANDAGLCGNTLRNTILATYNGNREQANTANVAVYCEQTSSTFTKEVSLDGKTWSSKVTAKPGDTVYYRLTFRNTGKLGLTNTTFKDTHDTGLSLVAGTSKVYDATNTKGKAIGDVIDGNGYSAGDVAASSPVQIIYRSQVANDAAFCGKTLKNTAVVNYNTYNLTVTHDASAEVAVYCERPSGTVEKQVSTDGKTWSKNITAKLGDTIYYQVVYKNTGKVDTAVNFADAPDAGINPVAGSTKSGNTTVGDIATGISAGIIKAGASATITYQAQISTDESLCDGTLNNTVTANYNSIGYNLSTDDKSSVTIFCERISSTTTKEVSTDGKTWSKNVTAKLGDKVYYRVTFANTGNVPINGVVLQDTPSAGINLTTGTTKASGKVVSDIASGYSISSLAAGASTQVTYEATVSADESLCDQSLVNTIVATYNANLRQEDTASVNVFCPVISSTIEKKVSTDGTNWSDEVTVKPGAIVYYRVIFANTGNMPIENITLTDVADSGLTPLNEYVSPQGIRTEPGATVESAYSAAVTTDESVCEQTLNNTVTATYGEIRQDASAHVNVHCSQASVTINKEVSTDGATWSKSAEIKPGDEVDFRITVTNDGELGTTYMHIIDTLPAGLTATGFDLSGDFLLAPENAVDENGEVVSPEYNPLDISLNTLSPNQTGIYILHAKAAEDFDCDNLGLTNTVTVEYAVILDGSEEATVYTGTNSAYVAIVKEDCNIIPEPPAPTCATNPEMEGCQLPTTIVSTGPLEVALAVVVVLGIGATGFYYYRTHMVLKNVESKAKGKKK